MIPVLSSMLVSRSKAVVHLLARAVARGCFCKSNLHRLASLKNRATDVTMGVGMS